MHLSKLKLYHLIPLWFRVKLVAQASKEANAQLMDRCWIENDIDGFTGWRWEKYKVERVIVCAANRHKDFIVTGSRHFSVPMLFTMNLLGGDALHAYGECEQGFIDQYGMFWNRTDAYNLCVSQGRKLLDEGQSNCELFSEHLY